MRDVIEILAPTIAFAILFSVVFGFLGYLRYLRYKETIALAERGLLRPEKVRRRRNPRIMLYIGVMALVVGFCLMLVFLLGALLTETEELIGLSIVLGCLPALFGLGLTAVYFVSRWDRARFGDDEEEPVPSGKGS